MKQETLINLGLMLIPEKYPYEKGLAPRFAKALLGENAPLIEAYQSASGGLGINSRTGFLCAIEQLEVAIPELLENGIPFPRETARDITIEVIPVLEAKKIVNKFS